MNEPNSFYEKLKNDQVDCPIEFKKIIEDNFEELLYSDQVSSCNFCLNYNKHQECKPELGICSAYIDKRYLK